MREPVAPQVGHRPPAAGGTGSPRGDGGFTLAELLAALAVIAVGLFGLATVFAGSTRATGAAGGRTQAIAVAAGELERLGALPYDDLGLVGGDPPGTESATADRVVGNRVFAIATAVEWAPAGPDPWDRYKRVTVTVSWADGATTESVAQSLTVYPGGLGPADATTSTSATVGAPGKARNLRAVPTLGSESTSVDLSWGLTGNQPTLWEVEQSSDGGVTWVTVTTTLPGTARDATAAGLQADHGYRFRVRGATGTARSAWTYRNVRTQVTGSTARCTFQATSAVPVVVARSTGGLLAQAVDVLVTTSGACTGTYHWEVVPVPEDPSATAVTGTMSASNGLFRGSIPATVAVWTAGEKLVRVVDGNGVVVGQATLTVAP